MKNQTINTNPIDCNIEQCAKMMISGIDHHANGATVNVNLYNGKLNYIFHLLRFFFMFHRIDSDPPQQISFIILAAI